jgi:hypothetical protein
MIRYIMYKNKINNIQTKRLPKNDSRSSENHLYLKWGCHKDVKTWINHWGMKEEATMKNNDNIKSNIEEIVM